MGLSIALIFRATESRVHPGLAPRKQTQLFARIGEKCKVVNQSDLWKNSIVWNDIQILLN